MDEAVKKLIKAMNKNLCPKDTGIPELQGPKWGDGYCRGKLACVQCFGRAFKKVGANK